MERELRCVCVCVWMGGARSRKGGGLSSWEWRSGWCLKQVANGVLVPGSTREVDLTGSFFPVCAAGLGAVHKSPDVQHGARLLLTIDDVVPPPEKAGRECACGEPHFGG